MSQPINIRAPWNRRILPNEALQIKSENSRHAIKMSRRSDAGLSDPPDSEGGRGIAYLSVEFRKEKSMTEEKAPKKDAAAPVEPGPVVSQAAPAAADAPAASVPAPEVPLPISQIPADGWSKGNLPRRK